jgi:hypothetical protein
LNARALFELLAQTTWLTLDNAHRREIAFGEDAVTSVNLLALASLTGRAVVVEDTRADEHHTGCDFELWVRIHKWQWMGYAVQAKKVSARTGRCEKLAHRVNGQRQIGILRRYSKERGLAPLYCFFSGVRPVTRWNCQLPQADDQLGCMVTPLRVVENALKIRGARSFAWLHRQPESVPWRCLVTCMSSHLSEIRDGDRTGGHPVLTVPTERLPDELALLWERRRSGVIRESVGPGVLWEGVAYYPSALRSVESWTRRLLSSTNPGGTLRTRLHHHVMQTQGRGAWPGRSLPPSPGQRQ